MEEEMQSADRDFPAHEEYPLDFDADTGIDQYDLELAGADAGQNDSDIGVSAPPDDEHADFEIGYEDDAVGGAPAISSTPNAADSTSWDNPDPGHENDEEIGYEDGDFVTANAADTDLSTRFDNNSENVSADNGAKVDPQSEETAGEPFESTIQSEGLLSLDNDGGNGHSMDHTANVDSANDAGLDLGTTGSGYGQFDSFQQAEEVSVADRKNSHSPQQSLADSEDIPEILVTYKRGRYSLFGRHDEDPDTYFLSNTNELDLSLSHFLSSLRSVIIDDLSPKDEIRLRIGSLDLEFGEKSQTGFLSRTFREILDCHKRLLLNDEAEAVPLALELVVHQDCEDRLAELLAGVDAGKGLSELMEHSDSSEAEYEGSGVETSYDVEAGADDASHREVFGDDDISHEEDQEDAGTGDAEGFELVEADDTGGEASEAFGTLVEDGGSHISNDAEHHNEIIIEEEYYEETYGEYAPEGADGSDHEEYEGGDVAEISGGEFIGEELLQDSSAAIDLSAQQEPLATLETLTSFDNSAASAHYDREEDDGLVEDIPGSATYDNNLTDAFNADPALDMIQEVHDGEDDYRQVDDDNEGLQEETNDGDEGDVRDDISAGKVNQTEAAHASTAQGATPDRSSATSTINGDEIDFEAPDAPQFLIPDGDAQASANSSKGADEIDWEHDGDDEILEQSAVDLTSSTSGKRNRQTDDPENLADESDNKRRRT